MLTAPFRCQSILHTAISQSTFRLKKSLLQACAPSSGAQTVQLLATVVRLDSCLLTLQVAYSIAILRPFPLSCCFATVILLCHCHDPLPVMLPLCLCHTALPVMPPANLALHCEYYDACHCHATVPLSSTFAALMLYCHSHVILMNPYCLAIVMLLSIVMLLCHCCTALLVMLYAITILLGHCHAAWHCCNTLPVSYWFATVTLFFHCRVIFFPLSCSCATHAALSLTYCLASHAASPSHATCTLPIWFL